MLRLVILVLLIAFGYYAYKRYIEQNVRNKKGKAGEDAIAQVIKTCGLKGTLHRNVYITSKNGKTTEIDLIFITDKKIYIIESKNYAGQVSGGLMQNNWVVRYKNGNQYTMYNPIMQNNGHIRALSNQFGLAEDLMQSVIVFSDNADLSNIRSAGGMHYVIRTSELARFLQMDYSNSHVYLNEMGRKTLANTLNTMCNADPIKKYKHIQQVRQHKR